MKEFIQREATRLEYLRGTAATDRSTGELITEILPADPMRSQTQFKKLYIGLKSLDENYPDEKAKRIIKKIVDSSGDPVRMEIMKMHEKQPAEWYSLKQYVEKLRIGKKTIKKQLMALWSMKYLVRNIENETDASGRGIEVEYFRKTLETQTYPPSSIISTKKKLTKINTYIEGGYMCDLSDAIEGGMNTYEDLCSLFGQKWIEKWKQDGILIPIEGGKRYELK